MSLKIKLEEVSKRFKQEWILKNISLELHQGQRFAVTGHNGSGKSTLLKILSGFLTPSRGKITYQFNTQTVDKDHIFTHIAFAAPYIDLIEELTMLEMIQFQQQFKAFQKDLSARDIVQLMNMKAASNKVIKNFSSGMKQRLKLALAICIDSPLLLLDEPTTNLDQQGCNWYRDLIEEFIKERLIIVASNVAEDYSFCDQIISITDYK